MSVEAALRGTSSAPRSRAHPAAIYCGPHLAQLPCTTLHPRLDVVTVGEAMVLLPRNSWAARDLRQTFRALAPVPHSMWPRLARLGLRWAICPASAPMLRSIICAPRLDREGIDRRHVGESADHPPASC